MVHNLEAPFLLWKCSIPLKLGISLESDFLIAKYGKRNQGSSCGLEEMTPILLFPCL